MQSGADQTNRVIAAADAGLEHREFAFAFLKIQAGQREHGFKGAEFFMMSPRKLGDGGFDPRNFRPRQIVIANGRAIDLKPLVEAKQMRRGE